jgi:putative transposase
MRLAQGLSVSRPPRIPGFTYRGPYRYFLTFCTRKRTRAFEEESIVISTLSHFQRTGADEGFAILAFCFMPDHAHLLVEGTREDADLQRFAKLAKQRSGAGYRLSYGSALWQEGYYDRVLRREEDSRIVARYILDNPVRARLVTSPAEYAFSGSALWSTADLLESVR